MDSLLSQEFSLEEVARTVLVHCLARPDAYSFDSYLRRVIYVLDGVLGTHRDAGISEARSERPRSFCCAAGRDASQDSSHPETTLPCQPNEALDG